MDASNDKTEKQGLGLLTITMILAFMGAFYVHSSRVESPEIVARTAELNETPSKRKPRAPASVIASTKKPAIQHVEAKPKAKDAATAAF